ncbi:hypothetical protein K2173_024702 [Erythroxylum novogranatense]|uniref:DNA replication ATP-dependent helicase/nuclease n=1 Tax=Erythroxylum novogranatense TaxID=1862640 RepID=A0AAV8SVV9_9ROSI|nr:hypothetical protein K2173_024702 [Erythroxylum novogranatense]
MPPRKKSKSNSSAAALSTSQHSQKHQQQASASKFGIEQFFHRLNTPQPQSSSSSSSSSCCVSSSSVSKIQSFSLPPSIKSPLQHSADGPSITPADESPPVCKFQSFSPGMLIKQSQDDMCDEITWKISPVNQRLQAFSHNNNHTLPPPDSFNKSLTPALLHPCSSIDNKAFSITPPFLAENPISLSANRVGVKRVNPFHHDTPTNATVSSLLSPFRTPPPSLSFSHDKLADVIERHGASPQLPIRPYKKTLLELLDQVEDAISVDDPVSSVTNAYSSNIQDLGGNKTPPPADPPIEIAAVHPPKKATSSSSNCNLLVLEVSEIHAPVNHAGAQRQYKVLRLLNEQSGEERVVCLWEEWFYSIIAPGDTVNVIGEFDEQGKCDVNSKMNLLIVQPDILVSGTRVVRSFSCPRRSVLDERLKISEHSTPALVGTLLHQVFQAGLMRKNPTVEFLEEYARIVLQKNIDSLYACGVHEKDLLKILFEAIPKLLDWILRFKEAEDPKASVDFGSDHGLKELRISEVIDIEEMAWAPKYGLKGMIDASVKVRLQSSRNGAEEKIVPLEFKTGKLPNGQSSMEHTAQVILYTLLMSERYLKHIDSGLLYYLPSDETRGVSVQRSDLVGLIMRRNELAVDILKASNMQHLPPMLRSPSICRTCRHLDVCTIYHKVYGGSKEASGLGELFQSHVHHLTAAHCAFFQHWDRLIDLEAKEMQLVKNSIWQSRNTKNAQSTSYLSSMVLDTSDGLHCQKDNQFIYRFARQRVPCQDEWASNGDSFLADPSSAHALHHTLKIGDYVILSTESGQAIANGIIMDISQSLVSVSFTKRLRLPGSDSSAESATLLQEIWRIEKDELMTSFSVMRFNLVQLFVQSAENFHLRKTIVDLQTPRFDNGVIVSQDPAMSYIWSVKSLNDDQRRAIFKILTAKDYTLILGMPGTGKTSTIVHAVKALLMRGASILLTSYTNSAVDNLLIKLKAQGVDFLRIGRQEAVHEEVRANCSSAMNAQSVEDIRFRTDQVKVVAVTCLGITSPLLANKKFDVCIMDEAGQITLPVSLGPLMLASMFVLVGDHYQLPPLVQSTEARENGMGISLFCRLSEAHPQAISALQSQYRMSQGIMELSNALIYGDRLRCGSSDIANARLKISNINTCSSWINDVLNPSRSVIFVNTDMLPAFEVKDSKALSNPIEAYIISEVTNELINGGIGGEDIGVITPYNSQANLIRTTINSSSVEVHTIDKYQGRDKDCILVSFVRSNENPKSCNSSLLGDWHRINVALTRAKKKLIMVGSCKTLSKVPLLKLLVKKVNEQSGILSISKTDFNQKGLKKDHSFLRCSHLL